MVMSSVYKEPKTSELFYGHETFNPGPFASFWELPQPLLQLVHILAPSSKLYLLFLVIPNNNH